MRQSVLLCCWENERALEALAQCSPVAWPVIGPGGKVCGCSVAHTDPSSSWAAAVSRSRTQQQTSDYVQTTDRQRRRVRRVEGRSRRDGETRGRQTIGNPHHSTRQKGRGGDGFCTAARLARCVEKLVPKSVRQLPSERLNHDCFRVVGLPWAILRCDRPALSCVFSPSRRSQHLRLPAPSFCVQPFFQPQPPPPYPCSASLTTAVLSTRPYRRCVTHLCGIKSSVCCTTAKHAAQCLAARIRCGKKRRRRTSVECCYRFYFCAGRIL